ncbi:MAG: translation initiation factor IF-1 [Candidatus Nealsonbacteria bacterium RIFCSPLOWO2_12_FULL_39_31]|uniref:Translation initiation factor IF-1 n=1 Tax=Candidatus Nealsonbacteria bacterium RIFCSPLOWO2_12_FULL_39_31 TaxID=1801676 RepID=A0A1G2EKB5_9BACT|nr:MAG: translation initiation factor IF-1 [Candidatus Nealsonbacteria bacterium RIFCSPLOWO2_12_FULL_39_31]
MNERKSEVKQGLVVYDGIITESLPNNTFRTRINIDNEEQLIVAHISGRMRRNFIRVMPGDKIKVEMSVHDLTKGRVVYRY